MLLDYRVLPPDCPTPPHVRALACVSTIPSWILVAYEGPAGVGWDSLGGILNYLHSGTRKSHIHMLDMAI